MFRPVTRLIARSTAVRAVPRASAPTRRFLSTAPPTQKSRSWKSLAARLGAVGAIIYYYNTTEVFAEEPRHTVRSLPETEDGTEQLPTVEDLAKERQQRKAEIAKAREIEAASKQETAATTAPGGDVEQLEEEADQQGAFNPETGEINWDCPCLGGMAHGPCGEEFKAAFSCFVYSTEEPKGMDCIDKFKDMQNCFRQYPEVYGAELETDEDDDVTADDGQPLPEPAAVTEESKPTEEKSKSATEEAKPTPQLQSEPAKENDGRKRDRSLVPDSYRPSADSAKERAKAATEQVREEHEPVSESDRIIPKAAHDEREASEGK